MLEREYRGSVFLARPSFLEGSQMNRVRSRSPLSRSQIAIDDKENLRRWMKHLDVTEEELRNVIERVGNSVGAVRRELNARKHSAAGCEQPPPEEDLDGDIVSLESQPSTEDDQPL